jgi:hypothetical protein
MSEQWCIGFTRTALREHKKLIPEMKAHPLKDHAKTVIQLPAELSKKEVEKRLKKYQTL